ncbi:unnamed protein product [Peronospora belbahrii]|uniref:Myb-like, SWIRM and MPN domain-containing protein 1 n=1 Tax=Peronospora belbahrii TaxID=622444 RepID=A0ABN8D9N3_9STRA|nr:unnamed protein product [Peronospora belbahrii]
MVAPGAKKSQALDPARKESLRAQYEALSLVEERFHNFDIVWAKVHGFPWWPGVFFYSWEIVLNAGIRTDPKIVMELVVPPPEKTSTCDGVTGQETGRFHMKRHCLIMFLDKFNFSVLEINANNVAGFTTHYHLYERAVMGNRSSKWGKKKAEFKRAIVKAVQLLHLGKEYGKEELIMLEEPSVVEKKKKDVNMEFERNENDWMDDGNGDISETGYDAAALGIEGRESGVAQSIVRKEHVTEVKDVENDNEVVILVPAKPRWQEESSKEVERRVRKRSQREDYDAPHVAIVSRSPSPIDLTETPVKKPRAVYNNNANGKGSETSPKPKKKEASAEADEMEMMSLKKSSARVLVMENGVSKRLTEKKDKMCFDATAGIIEDKEPNSLVLSPLSSIWTTGVSRDSSDLARKHTQLAYKQDFVWDGAVFTDERSIAEKEKAAIERKQAEDTASGRERSSGKRQLRSVQQSQIRQNMMTGDLDPHTMVQCAVYRPKDYVDDPNSRSRGGFTLDPPFQVVVHPDAVFVADLHAHLATCEIIGFLGGKWDEASKILYIQAAFPCRSLVIDGDDGSTDVEMDPGSEIELRGIIENAQLEVVGWYHSHPAFAPDPSVRDIENQTSYQQLFQRPNTTKQGSADTTLSEPFVGLIVGTYDTRRSTPVSLLRFFHTRVEKVSGGACREIYMPYEFIPERRHFRKVLEDEEREKTRLFPMYRSVLQYFSFELAATPHQLPMDIKTTPAQRAMSRLSPTRVKVCGFAKKRKQKFDGAVDKPMKKARARRRRSVHSFFAAESHIDVAGAGDNESFEVVENGTLTPTNTLGTGHDGSTDVVTESETITLDSVCEEKRMISIAASSGGVEEDSESNAEEGKSELCSVDSQVAEVLADIIETTQATNSSENGCDLPQMLKQSNETLASSDGAECNQSITENTVASLPQASTVCEDVMQHTISHSNDAAKALETDLTVDTIAESTDTRVPQSLSAFFSSAIKSGVLPLTNVSISSRKRTRKPKTTTRNSNRSISPSVSPGVVPCQTNSTGQAFYDAFRPSGPRFANGGTLEVMPLFSRPDGSKGDSVVEDVRYIVVDETMGLTSHGSDYSAKAKDDKLVQVTKTTDDDYIKQEIQCFVTSLVEKVAERVVSEIRAGTKVNVQGRTEEMLMSVCEMSSVFSDSSTVQASVDDVKMESTSMKPEFTVNVDVKKSTMHAGLQLFGSNGECEDIQTSLQKMAGYLDKLKSSQTTMPSAAKTEHQHDSTPDTEPEVVVVRAELKHGEPKVKQDHLAALRTKYGAGVSGCAEQVITLVDYYRDFERRTDLNEIWKARMTKLEKIESSLSEYVQYLNIPVALRRDFIKDLILYLRKSWAINDRRR